MAEEAGPNPNSYQIPYQSYPKQKMSHWGFKKLFLTQMGIKHHCCCQGIWRQTWLTKWEHKTPKNRSSRRCVDGSMWKGEGVWSFSCYCSVSWLKIYFFWHMNVLCKRSEDETPFWGEASRSISWVNWHFWEIHTKVVDVDDLQYSIYTYVIYNVDDKG